MPQPELPPEIIQIILDNFKLTNKLDMRDLCAVSLTCRNLYNLVTPLIYSEVTLSNYDSVDHKFFSFVETMLNNPHLASLLKSYSGTLYPDSSAESSLRFEPLKGWLQNIVNVKTMHLNVAHDLAEIPFPKCPFRLESLDVALFQGNELDIEPFLEDQPDLSSLHFYHFQTTAMRPLSLIACPNLKALTGNSFAAKYILPGRKVVRFEWEYEWDWEAKKPVHLSANSFSEISEELNNLRSLSYNMAGVKLFPQSMFKVINPANAYLRSLRFLEIEAMLPEDWVAIPTLPNLRVLFVLESPNVGVGNASLIKHQALIPGLFTKCPTLQCVDLHNPVFLGKRSCGRWLRGAKGGPVIIPLEVAEKGRTEFLDDDFEDV
ncbi:hypothetical protein GALMADRAFT_140977 [Galerina marginata CBS 339.88]|uniref:F-box domain-containing protein n=1 Tax=Galerina marginata (strain CBS 339.88) TaxID=685588 RepID=A0A067SX21_GALM3|nr:hypothetical protein GALMADRAFT_140977 [Galerina marginata CBS 339.88]